MTVTLEEAQKSLPNLIANLKPGDELTITKDSQPVAQVVPVEQTVPLPQFGSCRGKLVVLADDDEHLKDFNEYMP
jgi:antitoxin (DNA-binding transcriptional repressor) of toxin-antitoxin stability system